MKEKEDVVTMQCKKIRFIFYLFFVMACCYFFLNVFILEFAHTKGMPSKKSIQFYEEKQDLSAEETFELSVLYYNLSLVKNGNIKLSKKTLKTFKKARKLYAKEKKPESLELEAYIGSTHTLIGRNSKRVKNKIYHTNLGISHLDKAVRKNRDHLPIRIIRLSTNISLPALFKRKQKIIEDINFISKTDFDNNKDLLQKAYYALSKLEKNSNTKKEFIQKASSLESKSKMSGKK